MKKPWKIIKQDNGGELHLFGNHHWKEIKYEVPEWSEYGEEEACFTYLGYTYFLSEFMRVNKYSPFYKLGGIDFQGYKSDSFFSGILIHYSDCNEAIQVFTYIG